MSSKRYTDWCNEQIAAHEKQARMLRGKEKKAHELRVWHEQSAANFRDMLEGKI